MVGLVLEWIEEMGGVAAVQKENHEKAEMIYGLVDNSDGFFRGTAKKENRSYMNLTFRLPTEDLEKQIVAESKKDGFIGIKGHRSAGGLRVSNYNAVPRAGIEALVSYLSDFAKKHA